MRAIPLVLSQMSRFALVGLIATSLHYAIMIAMVQGADISPVIATVVGAAAGALCSYLANRRVTFHSVRRNREAVPRFILVATAGLLLNAVVMWLLFSIGQLHYLIAQIVATLLVLLWNFYGNRRWTF